IRSCCRHAFLSLTHFTGSHHFHRRSDLLCAFDACYLRTYLFTASHELCLAYQLPLALNFSIALRIWPAILSSKLPVVLIVSISSACCERMVDSNDASNEPTL